MHRHIIHLLYVLILSYAVTAKIKTVKMTVLHAHCNSKPCSNIELYYTTGGGCFYGQFDYFEDPNNEMHMLDLTKPELSLLPPNNLQRGGRFVLVLNEGGAKIKCCEITRNSSYTDKTTHLEDYITNPPNYSFDLRFQTIFEENTYCSGFYCEDCIEPEIMAWVDETHAIVGETTVLQCNVTSSSGVRSIYWKTYNTTTQTYDKVVNSDRLRGGNISVPSLTIRHVQIEDEGNYTCFAEKGRKTASSEPVYLDVIEAHITGTFRSTAVSGFEKTKRVSSTVSSVINSTTSSMTTSSMTTGTSILSTTLLTSPSNMFTEQPVGNNTITTTPSSKSTFISTKPTVAVHIGDTNSRLNASSHSTKLETTTCWDRINCCSCGHCINGILIVY